MPPPLPSQASAEDNIIPYSFTLNVILYTSTLHKFLSVQSGWVIGNVRLGRHPSYPNIASGHSLDSDAGIKNFLGVDAVRVTGNEAVSDTIITSVQNYISCIDDVGPQMQRTKYSNELAFENDCLALAHIDLLQQVRTQLLGDNRCFFPRESTMTAPKLPSKQPEDRFDSVVH